jgi:hypothetical protein
MGSNSAIKISKESQKSLVLKGSDLVEENTEPWLILGHELIHADRNARGARVKLGTQADYVVKGKWNGTSGSGKHTASVEELQTVGIIDGNDITENAIRGYNNMPMVAIYETDLKLFFEAKWNADGKPKLEKQKTRRFSGPSQSKRNLLY